MQTILTFSQENTGLVWNELKRHYSHACAKVHVYIYITQSAGSKNGYTIGISFQETTLTTICGTCTQINLEIKHTAYIVSLFIHVEWKSWVI